MALGPLVGGVLEPGVHDSTVAEVRERFVDDFAASSRREGILEDWLLYREALQFVCPIDEEWIDGSFTTDKLEPGDIDLVVFVDAPTFEALSPARQKLFNYMILHPPVKQFWSCDAYAVPRWPVGHPLRTGTEQATAYWENMFGHTRSGAPKGIVRLL